MASARCWLSTEAVVADGGGSASMSETQRNADGRSLAEPIRWGRPEQAKERECAWALAEDQTTVGQTAGQVKCQVEEPGRRETSTPKEPGKPLAAYLAFKTAPAFRCRPAHE